MGMFWSLAARIGLRTFAQRNFQIRPAYLWKLWLRTVSDGDHRLKLSGITIGDKFSLCIINGKTLNEGESAKIPIARKLFVVQCPKIQKDSVLIVIEGEDAPRSLHLK